MSSRERSNTTVYPYFEGRHNFWFARLGGSGLGNCFYPYFHAYVLSLRNQASLVAPPWFSFKLGPLLRGEPSKRFYWRMFRTLPGDTHGVAKLFTLLRGYPRHALVDIDGISEPALVSGALNVVVSSAWTFNGLHQYRDAIRERMLAIVRETVPAGHRWGQGGFIGMHVRLSDFLKIPDPQAIARRPTGTRIPLQWYMAVARALRKRYPDMPIMVFSDGQVEELQPLLDLGTQLYRSGSDVIDLLAMAGASMLVGSNSTYSRWAGFLGNMPSIWLAGARIDREPPNERIVEADVPVQYVPIDATEVTLSP
jgi:hypothetical protein